MKRLAPIACCLALLTSCKTGTKMPPLPPPVNKPPAFAAVFITFKPAKTNVVISWPSYYSISNLQATPKLNPSAWSPLTNKTSGTNAVVLPSGGAPRFLRALTTNNQGGVTLYWTASVSPGITNYNIWYGGAAQTYTNRIAITDLTNGIVPGLVIGRRYFFAVTADNALGFGSGFSNEANYIVPAPTLTISRL